MIISIQGKTQSKGRAATCARNGFKAFSLSMMAINWWTSRWFGNFYLNANGWARHEKLGWVFPMESPTAGLWLWKRDLGWLWTDKGSIPSSTKTPKAAGCISTGSAKASCSFTTTKPSDGSAGRTGSDG